MWEKVGVEKIRSRHAVGARRNRTDPARPAARHADRQRRTRSANYEWLDAIDVVNMIDACELIIHSSLERKESRGPFIPSGFPADRQCAIGWSPMC